MSRISWCAAVIAIILMSCSGKKIPDVSGVKADVQIQRFDEDFFALDTTNVDHSLQKLHAKYPEFLSDFIYNILALPPQPDSSMAVEQEVLAFIKSYRSLKESSANIFTNFTDIEQQVGRGLQFVKYYFPDYKLPSKLITFIGPINSYANILTADALAIGLQLYMGKDYLLYASEAGQEMYPAYISRRFSKEYIPVNCLKTIVDDLIPDNSAGRPLIEQMVHAGKRLYLLDKFMPEAEDTLKTGYTKQQLDGSFKNEGVIWSYFVQNDLLYVSDPSISKDYMNEAPITQAFGPESPGNIGQFVGWQIVKKWMGKNEQLTLQQLLDSDPKKIFQEAKYKP